MPLLLLLQYAWLVLFPFKMCIICSISTLGKSLIYLIFQKLAHLMSFKLCKICLIDCNLRSRLFRAWRYFKKKQSRTEHGDTMNIFWLQASPARIDFFSIHVVIQTEYNCDTFFLRGTPYSQYNHCVYWFDLFATPWWPPQR